MRLSALPLLILIVGEADALAFRCTAVPNSSPLLTQAWDIRCIPYWINQDSQLFSGQDRRDLISQSWRTWSGNACTDLNFYDAGYTSDGPGFDDQHPDQNKNVIIAIEDSSKLSLFSDPGLIALTQTSFSVDTGEILDADIMLNAVRFKFIDVTDQRACAAMISQPSGPYDLRNTITHEMGHFIGFDHDPDVTSVMFATAQPCETSKRQLNATDQQGLCRVYPKDQPTKTCSPPAAGYDSGSGNPAAFRRQCDRAMGLITSTGGCTSVQVRSVSAGASASWAGVLVSWAIVSIAFIARRGVRSRRRGG